MDLKIVRFAAVSAACLLIAALAALAGEAAPSNTNATATAGTATADAPETTEKKVLKIYIKGEDLLSGMGDEPVSSSTSWVFMHQAFELAQDSARIRKKYDKKYKKDGGYDGLRKKLGINVALKNVSLYWLGRHKIKTDEDGKKVKVKYTDAELEKLADFVVETESATRMEEIKFHGKTFEYKYYATVAVKVTETATGKVVFEKQNTEDYTNSVRRGKKFTAVRAVRKAVLPLMSKAVALDNFKSFRKGVKQEPKTPEEKESKKEEEPTSVKPDKKSDTPEKKKDEPAPEPDPHKGRVVE